MSAYGAIQRAYTGDGLPSTVWCSSSKTKYATIHHLTLQTAKPLNGLIEYLHQVFAKEVDDGRTYPQERPIDLTAFESYFFAADVFIAILGAPEQPKESSLGVAETQAGRSWEDCVTGYYYVKPNYPGRSSHICNAGFVVPPSQRGQGAGSILAKSYVHYAPKLGYQASVFNLVYVNNTASIKLWERLGFTKAGRIPRAGRLKQKDGTGEEYVDAWVFYKSFMDAEA
ncbi:uncharacterized protein EV420DRAFT_1619475 [Desarmillaria tabescens]|uniref:N-acetyltransferase domain-containing protein n=1 Tax=Armillaria tabescens TaxID=1929756 RepID=A0AA39TJ85_ARMTA|nr:uncharacterized protein EV420DRAFT_1619475 [Desarmillaria tabescens]KAK0460947.1 hypothetical protein EV420DRAFT_1619475 [Desarmillaria tabescens]